MKVLLISDKANWAYYVIAEAIRKYNTSDIIFDHLSFKQHRKKIQRIHHTYDLVFVLGWQNTKAMPYLDKSKTVTGVHSHQSYDDRKTTPEKDVLLPKDVSQYLLQFRAINTVSTRLYDVLYKSGVESTYTPNGVDTDIFKPKNNFNSLVVCTASASKNDWNKGVKEIIQPACKNKGIPIVYAGGKNLIAQHSMPSFYQRANCYICASKAEGMSLSILEAASSGCVIISTRCGNTNAFLKEGQNGFFVNRTIESVEKKLNILKRDNGYLGEMSKAIREEMVLNWQWATRAKNWIKFIERQL